MHRVLVAGLMLVSSAHADPLVQRPTATEVFHLRSECAALADKLMHGFEELTAMVQLPPTVRSPETYAVLSHYDPSTNRCYADLTSGYVTPPAVEHTHRALYDAQTKDILASAFIDGDKRHGQVFEAGRKYISDADGSYDDANDYIDAKMADDRKQ